MITALKNADKAQKEQLIQWITATDFDPEEKVREITAIFDQLKVKDSVEEMIKTYYDSALESLKALNTADEKKTELFNFASDLMGREK